MTTVTEPELISFKVCPFVQRSAIALLEKKVAFKTTYVDLRDLPDWFDSVSPLGKVPVLKIGNSVVFESAVIAEYLDEAYSPRLHPQDLLTKAEHRSWTEFASDVTMNMFQMIHQVEEEDFLAKKQALIKQLNQVEGIIDSKGPFFAGDHFSLVDASYAPILLRLKLIEKHFPLNVFNPSGRLAQWSEALLSRDSVIHSVVDDFEEIFMAYTQNSESYLRKT